MADSDLPDLPYGHDPATSGWSGSDTSRARAVNADGDGTTRHRQQKVLTYLAGRGAHGATWREVADAFNWHHGQASGVLSVLHKTGRIIRLVDTRDRCKVYVLADRADYVAGRRTETQGRTLPASPAEEWWRSLTPAQQETVRARFGDARPHQQQGSLF